MPLFIVDLRGLCKQLISESGFNNFYISTTFGIENITQILNVVDGLSCFVASVTKYKPKIFGVSLD